MNGWCQRADEVDDDRRPGERATCAFDIPDPDQWLAAFAAALEDAEGNEFRCFGIIVGHALAGAAPFGGYTESPTLIPGHRERRKVSLRRRAGGHGTGGMRGEWSLKNGRDGVYRLRDRDFARWGEQAR